MAVDTLESVAAGGPRGQYKSLTQIIVELLRERIFSGEYCPGARLNIADLSQHFKVSPVPVREALRNLETEGLVREFHLNRGVVVRALSADEVRELFLIRRRLEALAAVEAARTIDEEHLKGLEATLAEMDKAAGSDDWHTLHTRFHEDLNRAADLPRLAQLAGVLRGQMRPYAKLYLGNAEHLAAAQSEHYALVAALRARDTDAIEKIVVDHLTRPALLAIAAFEKGAEYALEAAQ